MYWYQSQKFGWNSFAQNTRSKVWNPQTGVELAINRELTIYGAAAALISSRSSKKASFEGVERMSTLPWDRKLCILFDLRVAFLCFASASGIVDFLIINLNHAFNATLNIWLLDMRSPGLLIPMTNTLHNASHFLNSILHDVMLLGLERVYWKGEFG